MFRFDVGAHGRTSGAIFRAADPSGVTLILAHGAGAPRTHPFMVDIARRLSEKGLDVVTFNFLYAEAGRKMPDRVELLEACWASAIAAVRARGGLRERLFIGGKSMGGRMATHIQVDTDGLVLFGYPLHPIGKPRVVREEILAVTKPLLVIQGTRDELGTAAEMKRFLGERGNARVHVVEGGDHSLALPRREGEEAQERALASAVDAVVAFTAGKRPRVADRRARVRRTPTKPRQ